MNNEQADQPLTSTIDELKEREARLRAIVDTATDAIITMDGRGIIRDFNKAAEQLFGYGAAEAIGSSVSILMPSPFREEHDGNVERHLRTGIGKIIGIGREVTGQRKDGSRFPLHLAVSRVSVPEPLFTGILHDLSAIKQVERELLLHRERLEELVAARVQELTLANDKLHLFASIFETTIEGILITDVTGTILQVNPAFTTITGYSPEEVIGRNPRLQKSNRHPPEFYQEMWRCLLEEGQWQGEIWNRRKNGEPFPEWLAINAIRDERGRITSYVAVFYDMTKVKQGEAQLEFQAYHDALTGLPNRLLFTDRLERLLTNCQREESMLAVMFLDLDKFKDINDTLGHDIGDLLLQEVAQCLLECARDADTVARLGGDEFTVLLPGIKNGIEDAVVLAKRIINRLAQPFLLKGYEVLTSTSIGITIFPGDGEDATTLVKNADIAMYQAKSQGRNRFEYFKGEMRQELLHRLDLEHDLRMALERNEFEVHYQPKMDVHSGRITGAEALVRWRRADGELIPPNEFLPLAEETGLIFPLGEWVLRTACRQMRVWHDQGFQDLTLAVNISAKQFQDGNFVAKVKEVLAETGLPASGLHLEINENMVMWDVDTAIEIMDQFFALGVKLSVDDFGTGYSSLTYLRKFPLNILKIDKSFVQFLPGKGDDVAMARTILSLARNMVLKTVAEGVENSGQLACLKEHGCDEIQGFLVSRPVTADKFIAILAQPQFHRLEAVKRGGCE
jgi:diguanylate cyclase (GGDEF)-like protein/PAS domain S-box-containing protein